MGDRRIDADQQIDVGEPHGGVGEIGNVGHHVGHGQSGRLDLATCGADLETGELDAGDVQQGREHIQAGRPALIDPVGAGL